MTMSFSTNTDMHPFFETLARAAAAETLPRFRMHGDIANKLDNGFDPVTEADQAAESAIRTLIGETYAEDGIIGEEHGRSNEGARRQWIIDPIDGTRAFITGLPVWGTLIGLYDDGVPLAGCMSQPFTRELFVGFHDRITGAGHAHLKVDDGEWNALQTRKDTDLSTATILTTTPAILSPVEQQAYGKLENLCRQARYGCDCYAYCMVAAGHADLVVESGLNIYDIAALIPIIEGAGGIVTSWNGGNADQGGQILAAANERVHAQALEVLASAAI